MLAMIFLLAALITGLIRTEENLAYVTLNDGTAWKVCAFERRWRNPVEWWNDDTLGIPQSYLIELKEWQVGMDVEVIDKWLTTIDISNASNKEQIASSTHVFYYAPAEWILLANQMAPQELLTKIFTAGKSKGHSEGYNLGYSSGYSLGYSLGKSSTPNSNHH